MEGFLGSLSDGIVQCWGCTVFDKLFQIVSLAAAGMYDAFSSLCLTLFFILFAVFVVSAIVKNIKRGGEDPFYKKTVQKVFINSVVVLGLLGLGIKFPRFISLVIFEPITDVTIAYSQSMLKLTESQVEEKVTYQPIEMKDVGFYRPELRDKIIQLMKATITQFQGYIKLGFAVMDNAFIWKDWVGVGTIFQHLLLFFMGVYISWAFLKLFFRYCCYFVDTILAMALFAFFFPLSLVMMIFKGVDDVPKWFNNIGKKVGAAQIKNLINAIVTLASVVITYTVIVVILAKFFSPSGVDASVLMESILSGEIYGEDLNASNLQSIKLLSCIALMYIVNYIFEQIPQISQMIMSAFSVEENKKYGDEMADNLMVLSEDAFKIVTGVGKTILSGGKDKEDKKEGKKEDTPKEDKPKEDKGDKKGGK